MQETGTFSALIDDAIQRSRRKDRIADIMSYARASMRECTVLANFQQSLVEDTVTVTASPHIWDCPQEFRILVAFQYANYSTHGERIVPTQKRPGQVIHDRTNPNYYYRSGDSYILAGVEVGEEINVAYLAYLKRLRYYATEADRPARFDVETNLWVYHSSYDTSTTQQQVAKDLCTNWLMFRWYDLVLEGTLAKLYKTVGDTRSVATYALYKQQQTDLKAGEQSVTLGV